MVPDESGACTERASVQQDSTVICCTPHGGGCCCRYVLEKRVNKEIPRVAFVALHFCLFGVAERM